MEAIRSFHRNVPSKFGGLNMRLGLFGSLCANDIREHFPTSQNLGEETEKKN